MNTLYFIQQFPDETACREHYRDMRIKQGLTCKKCGGTSHFWLACKGQFECRVCHFRTALRSGTVMEHSNLSFRVWYLAILFMTATKKGISACEMQRQALILSFRTMSHPTVSYSLTKVKTTRIFTSLSICISLKNHQNSQRKQRLNGLTLQSAMLKELFLVSIIK